MLDTLRERIALQGITVTFDDDVAELLAREGFDPVYGARPLRRAIQSKLEDLFAEDMLDGKITAGDTVTVDYRDGKFVIEK